MNLIWECADFHDTVSQDHDLLKSLELLAGLRTDGRVMVAPDLGTLHTVPD